MTPQAAFLMNNTYRYAFTYSADTRLLEVELPGCDMPMINAVLEDEQQCVSHGEYDEFARCCSDAALLDRVALHRDAMETSDYTDDGAPYGLTAHEVLIILGVRGATDISVYA